MKNYLSKSRHQIDMKNFVKSKYKIIDIILYKSRMPFLLYL